METTTLACRQKTPEDLVRRCLLGRRDEDWSELLRRHGWRLRRMVWNALTRTRGRACAEDVDDVLQDLYLRLLGRDQRAFRGRGEHELWAYMARIAHSLAVDRRRLARAGKRSGRRRELGWERLSRVLDPVPSPEHAFAARQELGRFLGRCRRACGPDPELQMRVFHLAYFDGLTSAEIARALGPRWTPLRVDNLIHRLRRKLARRGVGLGRRRQAA